MAWIESHQELERHPKLAELVGRLGCSTNEGIGILHRLWWWCLSYAEDGYLDRYSNIQIGAAVGVEGDVVVPALEHAGFLERNDVLRVHDWWDYAGRFLQVKYKRTPSKWKAIHKLYGSCSNPPRRPPCNPKPDLTEPNQPDLTKPDLLPKDEPKIEAPQTTVFEEPDRVFEVEELKPLWAKCKWIRVEQMTDAWRSINEPRRPSFHRFLEMLVEKWEEPKITSPAGATICAFNSGKSPTDKGINRLKDILRPPGKRECQRVSQFDQDCEARNRFFRAGVEA